MHPTPLRKTLWALASLIVIYAICFFWIDRPVAYWAQHTFADSTLFSLSHLVKQVAAPKHWLGLAIIAGIIGMVLRWRGKTQAHGWLLFSGSIIVSLVICFVLKTVLGRYRPIELFEHQRYGFHGFSLQHNLNSSPSGHATAAFAGLFALSRLRRKLGLTVLLLLIGVIIALSRIIETDHFVSDVIFGAYVGMLSVCWVQWVLKLRRPTAA